MEVEAILGFVLLVCFVLALFIVSYGSYSKRKAEQS